MTWHQFYVVLNWEVCGGVCVCGVSACLFRCWVGEGGIWVGVVCLFVCLLFFFCPCVVCGLGFVWKNAL